MNITQQKNSLWLITMLIIVLILVGGGYFYSTYKIGLSEKLDTKPTTEIKQEVSVKPVSTGIIVTSIKPNDLVKMPITIEGYLDGKGWTANEGEIGLVEIFDANGKSVSNKEIIRTTTDWLIFPTYFKATVGDREMMGYIKTDTGTIKITNNSPMDGELIKTILIPVRFK